METPPPAEGLAIVTNVNPRTGHPAVLGELVDPTMLTAAEPDGAGMHWQPWQALTEGSGGSEEEIRSMAERELRPSRFLIRVVRGGYELLDAQPLPLSPACHLRYLHCLLSSGRINADDFLLASPAALSSGSLQLDPGRNLHLVPATSAIPVTGSVAVGALIAEERPSSSPTRREPFILVVDRVDARHATLLADARCSAILAIRGSSADHFSLLAREQGACYAILRGHTIDADGLRHRDLLVPFGTIVTVDGGTGRIFLGAGAVGPAPTNPAQAELLRLLEKVSSPIPIRVNLDTATDLDRIPPDVAGVGLVRTEHLLAAGGLERSVRAFVDDYGPRARRRAGAVLLRFFTSRLVELLNGFPDMPVAVRLLDYPLHELGSTLVRETNPMLGLRGIRQGLRWPLLYQYQIKAMLKAAVAVRRAGQGPKLELMVPFVTSVAELQVVRRWVERCQMALTGTDSMPIRIGAMVETPVAASQAGVLARECDFLSFGTNDLTQLALGLSRDDAPEVVHAYRLHGLMEDDPFSVLHPVVADMVEQAAESARSARPGVTIGVCGSHACDPRILRLCTAGLVDYLSVPPQQFPVAKLRIRQHPFSGSRTG
jgi:pyruvate, orthophosphate dikinase